MTSFVNTIVTDLDDTLSFTLDRDWENAKRSFEEGERVKIELNPDNHGHSENYAFGKILEVYLCGAKYKVLLDSGETKTFNSEFVSKIDMRKL